MNVSFRILLIVLFVLIAMGGLYAIGVFIYFRFMIATYANFWNKKANENIPNAITYVALGDSTAQGIGASNPMKGYVGIIANRISQDTGKPVHIINLSLTGARFKDVISTQLPQLMKIKPAIVTIEIGANDITAGISWDEFEKNMRLIASQLTRGTFIADMPYRERGTKEEVSYKSIALVDELSQQYGLIHVHLHDATKVHYEDWDQYARDLFHPSDKGYIEWANAFWREISLTYPSR